MLKICVALMVVVALTEARFVELGKRTYGHVDKRGECPSGQFSCDGSKCVEDRYMCDHEADCDDGSDESTDNCKCDGIMEYKCTDGTCLSKMNMCNGRDDCSDGIDEADATCKVSNADFKCNEPAELKCPENRCFPGEYRCDGYKDCEDNSDETGCAQRRRSYTEEADAQYRAAQRKREMGSEKEKLLEALLRALE